MSDYSRLDAKFDMFQQWEQAEHAHIREELKALKETHKEDTVAIREDIREMRRYFESMVKDLDAEIVNTNKNFNEKIEYLNNFRTRTITVFGIISALGSTVISYLIQKL